ncbi:tryptophan--tRNA ligase [Thermoproteota archaeon]
MSGKSDFIVTPWEVKGEIDYKKLIAKFGTTPITEDLIDRLEKHTGNVHTLIRRKIFFSHRDLNWILDKYEKDEKFFLYTGRGPSGHTHLGHLIPWMLTKHLQDKFGSELYFQMTDDEKFLYNQNLTLDDTRNYTNENILDVIACGFDPEKTFIFSDTEYSHTMYETTIKVAKHITFSTVKAVFGFKDSTNIGMSFFPAIQAAPCFFPSVLKGKNIPCLIPAAIDQDPYWRGIAREIAPKLGFYKPAQIHSKFIPGLGKGGKMSSSEPDTAIFTVDTPEIVHKKIMKSFTGGRATVQEQKKEGGIPEICPIYQYYMVFLDDDKQVADIHQRCKSGNLLCGEDKLRLSEIIKTFLKEHQRKRKEATKVVEKFILRD